MKLKEVSPETAPGLSAAGAMPRYGGKRDVAQMMQMSTRSVDNFLARGCPHLKIGKRRIRFDMSEVRAWLTDNFHTQRRGKLTGAS
jgi:predicted DNA-binding transcriptional regulator AlpA